ncbi:MAG: GspE/PulE family protein [Thiobacillus sp.]|nr:GspE/PulE family protein [Thiobacillus sp.]
MTETAAPPASPPPARQKIRLGDLLVEQKVISAADLDIALAAQKKSGRRLGRIIVESGLAGENDIAQALARQLNLPFIDLRKFNPEASVLQLLPEAQARRFRAIPLARRDGSIFVGMADPTDLTAYDEVARLIREDMQLAVVAEGDLLAAIDRIYRRTDDIHGLTEELARDMGESEASIIGLESLGEGQADAPVVRLLQTLFEDALQVGASDVHIEPQEKFLAIRFRIDGVLHPQTQADLKIAPALALRLKIVSGLDISEKRLPQDGRFAVKVRGRTVDVRLSTMPTQYGESVVMRLLSQGDNLISLDNLGMLPDMLERFRAILHRPNGLVLVTGPTGSGKTTTLYSTLKLLATSEVNVCTIEDPIELVEPAFNQMQVQANINLGFADGVRALLRQDPDIIMVGEIRDLETAENAVQAALTGHLVLSTLHTNDAPSAIIRLLDLGVPSYLIKASVLGVMAQRLVRQLCPHCKQPAVVEPAVWTRLTAGQLPQPLPGEVYEPVGCLECRETGYLGRVGAYEILTVDEALRAAMDGQSDRVKLHKIGRASGMTPLRIAAARSALQGKTSLEDVAALTPDLEL